MTTTPNMVLVLPDVSVTIGPDWANDINTAMERVDQHDHSTGNGVPVTPAGMEINVDLPFNSNNVTELRSARFTSQSSVLNTVNDKGCAYEVNGDLYYNNSAGTAVQITSGSTIVSPGGGLTSKFPASFPYTVLTTDAQKILLVSTTAARTINLPAATTNMFFEIKDITGSAQTNNITVTPNGSDTIEGQGASYFCNTNLGAWTFVSDGISAWYVV